jgi:hypothetical protein
MEFHGKDVNDVAIHLQALATKSKGFMQKVIREMRIALGP